jgi:hypothetical protein
MVSQVRRHHHAPWNMHPALTMQLAQVCAASWNTCTLGIVGEANDRWSGCSKIEHLAQPLWRSVFGPTRLSESRCGTVHYGYRTGSKSLVRKAVGGGGSKSLPMVTLPDRSGAIAGEASCSDSLRLSPKKPLQHNIIWNSLLDALRCVSTDLSTFASPNMCLLRFLIYFAWGAWPTPSPLQ